MCFNQYVSCVVPTPSRNVKTFCILLPNLDAYYILVHIGMVFVLLYIRKLRVIFYTPGVVYEYTCMPRWFTGLVLRCC